MNVYLLGIGGTGMSALAGLFRSCGHRVGGSDNALYPPVDRLLAEMNLKVDLGYRSADLPEDCDLFVVGNVISRGNPQLEFILDNDLEYTTMAAALGRHFISGRQSVVIAGTHGKTTCSAFSAHLFTLAGLNPGFFIGGKPLDLAANFQPARGEFFITEGDEYETAFCDRSAKFLKYRPRYLLIPALEYDHADFYPDENLYLQAFRNLVNLVPANGLIVVNGDDEMAGAAVSGALARVQTVSLEKGDYLLQDLRTDSQGISFVLNHRGSKQKLSSSLPGIYNARNLATAAALADHLGIAPQTVAEACRTFRGVERRFQHLRTIGAVEFYEDFAHHPTALALALEAAGQAAPGKKLLAVFEPGSGSLKRNVFQRRLAPALARADGIIIKQPAGLDRIPIHQRLDLEKLALELRELGRDILICAGDQEVRAALAGLDFKQPTRLLILSNGSFGGLPDFVRRELNPPN